MIFEKFVDEISSTYTYIIAEKKGTKAAIIDPVDENVNQYLEFIGKNNLMLTHAIDTHNHADHFSGLGKLRSITGCLTVIGEQSDVITTSLKLRHKEKITIGTLELEALHTPGHTDDSYCLYMPGMLFTGDTLLIRGNGRTDFQAGNAEDLYDSLTKLFQLPDSTTVLPAHDYKGESISTIAVEKKQNPRYFNKSKAEFVEIMDNLNLPNPKMMDIVLPKNIALGHDLQDGINNNQILNVEQTKAELKTALFVDLRNKDEIVKEGTISEAKSNVNIPYLEIGDSLKDDASVLNQALKNSQNIIFYCAYGERSALAINAIKDKQLKISHLEGGFDAWKKSSK